MSQKATDTAAFDWQTLLDESHQLVVEGKALNQHGAVMHAARNLLKFQAHLVAALAHLAGVPMPHMPRLEPMLFRTGVEMPSSSEWEIEVWPDRFTGDAEAAD